MYSLSLNMGDRKSKERRNYTLERKVGGWEIELQGENFWLVLRHNLAIMRVTKKWETLTCRGASSSSMNQSCRNRMKLWSYVL